MVKATKLIKHFDGTMVLNRISFNVEREHKIALTGFNGSGKTTLLNIIAGNESYSNGVLEVKPNVKIGFLPQEPKALNKLNVLDFLKKEVKNSGPLSAPKDPLSGSDEFLRKVEIMFAGFLLPTEVKEKNIGDLSSGQKTKVFLTSLLLQDIDLYLLDEPTNNLDLPALIWLEDFLQKTKSAIMIVSHDRAFLDEVTNKIFEIDWHDHSLHTSKAKYSDYLHEREQERKRLIKEHTAQKTEVARLATSAENTTARAVAGSKWKSNDNDKMLWGHKRNRAAKSFTTAKVTYGRIKRMDITKRPKDRKALSLALNMEDETASASKNISLKKVFCGYPDDFSVGPIDLDIVFGKKICLLGPNGSGKSTILKTITENLPVLSGELKIDSGVKFGHVMQEHESLPLRKTPMSFLSSSLGKEVEKELIHNHLSTYGFSDEAITSPISTLSPGNRARLLFAYFSATNVNTLILDEPTNHLDMEAEEALEEALKSFEGTVITVTHDRKFVEKMDFDALYVVSESGLNLIKDFKDYVKEMEKRSKKLLRMLGK
ncbi:ATP-binding cassette domain-containing protein [Candidatus Pacebacteria bacterium]|nr:ATP-binding cassette domain-containing protein [Candidatus Paceibacterota bacterium]